MAIADRKPSAGSFQLAWSKHDGIVTVTPEDSDRFAIKLKRAIDALQQASKQDEFKIQLRILLKTLAEWLGESSGVSNACLTLRDGCFSFVVVREIPSYSAEFEDRLSELDYRIAKDVDLPLIRLNVIALPATSDEALQAFFNPDFLLTFVPRERVQPSSACE